MGGQRTSARGAGLPRRRRRHLVTRPGGAHNYVKSARTTSALTFTAIASWGFDRISAATLLASSVATSGDRTGSATRGLSAGDAAGVETASAGGGEAGTSEGAREAGSAPRGEELDAP